MISGKMDLGATEGLGAEEKGFSVAPERRIVRAPAAHI